MKKVLTFLCCIIFFNLRAMDGLTALTLMAIREHVEELKRKTNKPIKDKIIKINQTTIVRIVKDGRWTNAFLEENK